MMLLGAQALAQINSPVYFRSFKTAIVQQESDWKKLSLKERLEESKKYLKTLIVLARDRSDLLKSGGQVSEDENLAMHSIVNSLLISIDKVSIKISSDKKDCKGSNAHTLLTPRKGSQSIVLCERDLTLGRLSDVTRTLLHESVHTLGYEDEEAVETWVYKISMLGQGYVYASGYATEFLGLHDLKKSLYRRWVDNSEELTASSSSRFALEFRGIPLKIAGKSAAKFDQEREGLDPFYIQCNWVNSGMVAVDVPVKTPLVISQVDEMDIRFSTSVPNLWVECRNKISMGFRYQNLNRALRGGLQKISDFNVKHEMKTKSSHK